MQKFFILIAFVLLSAGAAAAQTAREEKQAVEGVKRVEFANNVEGERALGAPNTAQANKPRAVVRDGRVLQLGPSTTYLKNGLTIEEVVRLLGKPVARAEREDNGARFSTYTFARSGGRVLVAEFENDVLVGSRTEATEKLARTLPDAGQ